MKVCGIGRFKLNIHRSCTFAFQCSEAGGAVLALPKGATVYEATNKLHFQQHAARHAVSWYKYMLKKGRDVTNGSLYFVTDCIKSVNWASQRSMQVRLPTTTCILSLTKGRVDGNAWAR